MGDRLTVALRMNELRMVRTNARRMKDRRMTALRITKDPRPAIAKWPEMEAQPAAAGKSSHRWRVHHLSQPEPAKRQAAHRRLIAGPWAAEKTVARRIAALTDHRAVRVQKAGATARRDAATAVVILGRRLTCDSRSSLNAPAAAPTVDGHPVTVADAQPQATVAAPLRPVTAAAVTAAAHRAEAQVTVAADRTVAVATAAAADMGGKTMLGPLPA